MHSIYLCISIAISLSLFPPLHCARIILTALYIKKCNVCRRLLAATAVLEAENSEKTKFKQPFRKFMVQIPFGPSCKNVSRKTPIPRIRLSLSLRISNKSSILAQL